MFRVCESVSCEVKSRLGNAYFRNFICVGGVSLCVSFWLISQSETFPLKASVIPRSIARISRDTRWVFSYLHYVECIEFESDSHLTAVSASAFTSCTQLRSICITASVEILAKCCFRACTLLSCVHFESCSRLNQIEKRAFHRCVSLRSLCLPPSLEMIAGSALAPTGISMIAFEHPNSHFCVSGNYVLDFDRSWVRRYFGSDRCHALNREIEILCTESFSYCDSLSSFTFEPGSKLRRIERGALYWCDSLRSVCIPASVESIGPKAFAWFTSLSALTFESGSKLIQIGVSAFGASRWSQFVFPPLLKFSANSASFGVRHFRQ
jgi:hypothetical protein